MSNSPHKVKSGPPMWIWLILIPLTLAVIGGLILTSIPPNLDTLYDEAVTALDDPNGKEVFEKNIAILKKDPDYADQVNYLEGRQALAKSRQPRALKLFAQISKDSPLKAQAELKTGDTYRSLGDFQKAIAAYERSSELSEDGGLEARLNLASLYFFAGAVQLSQDALDKNLEVDETHEDSRKLRARLHMGRLDHALARKDFESVLNSPGKFSSVPPGFVKEYFQCLIEVGDSDKLKEVAEEHLGLINDPVFASSVLSEIGDSKNAKTVLHASEGPSADGPDYKKARLKLLIADGKSGEAVSAANELRLMLPRDIEAMELAVKAYKLAGDQRMQKIAEENVTQLNDLKRQATEAISKVEGNITDAAGRAAIARIYEQLGDYSKTEAWYTVAAMLDDSLTAEFNEVRTGKTFPRTPLVPFEEKAGQTDEGQAADSNKTADEQAKSSESASEKSTTEQKKKAQSDSPKKAPNS